MAILSTGNTWATNDQVTAALLNQMVNAALFDDPADETSLEKSTGTGKLQIKDSGVSTAKIAALAVTAAKLGALAVETAKIAEDAVTNAKMAADAVAGSAAAASGDLCIEAASIGAADIGVDMISGTTASTDVPDAADSAQKFDSGANANREMTLATLAQFVAFPQAYGRVDFSAGNNSLTGGYNVSSSSGTGNSRQITLTNAMANTDYTVIVCEGGPTYSGLGANVVIDSTTQFTLSLTQAANRYANFAVFGSR